MCKDRLFPYIDVFAKGYGRNEEPRRAYVLAFVITFACTLIGEHLFPGRLRPTFPITLVILFPKRQSYDVLAARQVVFVLYLCLLYFSPRHIGATHVCGSVAP